VFAPRARRVFEPGRVFVVRVRRGFAGLVAVLVVGGVMFGGVSGASAIPTTTPCGGGITPTQSGSTATCSYASGASDTFTVPAGVTSVTITAVGGQGGSTGSSPCPSAAGGEGATVSATAVTVNPLDSLTVTVATSGGNGTTMAGECAAGGAGGSGAGSGGAGADGGGGGGGGSAVIDTTALSATLVVAGGGGGGGVGCTNCSTAGGDAGQQGGGEAQSGGFPGTQDGPGNAGTSLDGSCDGSALPGSGMNGGADLVDGGGGGGGYYGGGAGCEGGGGGGGSSYPAADVTGYDSTGTPSVTISYTVPLATPSIGTSQQPASATVGGSIADKATVSGGNNPTGTVTFNLYSNSTGSGTPLFTDANVALSGGTATSTGYTATATGTDYWVATYNGDSNNNSVTSGTSAEPVVISPATPSINTSQQPASATVGSSIADKATVSGGDSPTGTVTFKLYSNSNGTGLLFTDANVPLVGGVATSTGYLTTATAAGTDYWVATYNGDANNNAVSSGTASEPVTVGFSRPCITTTITGTFNIASGQSICLGPGGRFTGP
jgi:hypothetical protein